MAYYFIFPEYDTTLYSQPDRTKLNTGGDEILEIVKEKGTTNSLYYPSRVLIRFNNDDIKDTISDIVGHNLFNTKATCSLQLLSTEHKNLTENLNLEAYPLAESWFGGTGRYSNLPTSSNGSTWIYRDNDVSKTQWTTSSTEETPVVDSYSSTSIHIKEVPTASFHELTINGVDIIPVISTSLFDFNQTEFYVEVSSSRDAFGMNLADVINASSSFSGSNLTLVSASYITSSDNFSGSLVLSGSNSGSVHNVVVTTSSLNDQGIFTSSIGNFSLQGGQSTTTTVFSPGTSGSIQASGITEGGGVWYTGSGFYCTQQFLGGDSLDTNIDVTTITQKWSASLFNNSSYPTGIDNLGFIIKQPDIIEQNTSSSFGEMKYFSVNTHTIYPPKLAFKWDDSSHDYQSSAKQSGELNVSLYRNKEEYNKDDIATIRLHVRDKYPTRQFASSSNFLNVGYFTTSSYYSIRDAHTEEEVIPFDDNCTKISADSEGMYFNLYMGGLQPERYYRILFKHKNNEGTTIYDNDYHFKIIR